MNQMREKIEKSIKEFINGVNKLFGNRAKRVILYGSYARGEATESSDLDFLVFGGKNFKLTMIFSLAEDLREILKKDVELSEEYSIQITFFEKNFYPQSTGLENMQNPYGDGKTSDKIIRIIETKLFNTEVDLKKTFYDIE